MTLPFLGTQRGPCVAVLVGFCWFFLHQSFTTHGTALAATYRCEDAAGVTVLTDSPVQLHNCSLLFPDSRNGQQSEFLGSGASRSSSRSYDRPRNQPINETDAHGVSKHVSGDRGAAETTKEESVAIPVKIAGGAVMVPVLLNGERSAQLILDTGATMTVLATDIAVELGLLSDSRARVTTINTAGGPVQVMIGRLDSVQVGPTVARNVLVAAHDIPHMESGIDGLLGMSFLRHFLVTLDADRGRLYLRPRRDASIAP